MMNLFHFKYINRRNKKVKQAANYDSKTRQSSKAVFPPAQLPLLVPLKLRLHQLLKREKDTEKMFKDLPFSFMRQDLPAQEDAMPRNHREAHPHQPHAGACSSVLVHYSPFLNCCPMLGQDWPCYRCGCCGQHGGLRPRVKTGGC